MDRQLENPPLVEAKFVIQWKAPTNSVKKHNINYQLIPSKLWDRIKDNYGIYERLTAASLPEDVSEGMLLHKYTNEEDHTSFVQLGTNILAIDYLKNYTWLDFRKRIVETVDSLYLIYPSKEHFIPQAITLKYSNVIDLDSNDHEDIYDFLNSNFDLHFSIGNDSLNPGNSNLKSFTFDAKHEFISKDPEGFLALRFMQGKKRSDKERHVVFFDLVFQSNEHNRLPQIPSDLTSWLDNAHKVIEDWFFHLLKEDLIKRFES